MAGNVVVVWNYPALNHLLKSPTGDVGRDLYKRGSKILAAAKLQVGVRTGALKGSLGISHERTLFGQRVVVGSGLNYALLHHEGSRPHVILPKSGGTLRFRGRGGMIVHTPRVDHPGTRANKYLTRNLYLAIT